MRTLRKNQQKLQYALQIGEIPEFETDDDGNIKYDGYTDDDGNFFPYLDENGNKIAFPTGKYEVTYSEPVSFMASISDSGGEAEATMYGLSVSDYSAVMTCIKGTIPVKEGMLIWVNSEPQYKHIEATVNDIVLNGDYPIRESADFYVVKNPIALNIQRIPLQAINK